MDKKSWDLMPVWLRPTPSQLTTPHAAWIDRIPWFVKGYASWLEYMATNSWGIGRK